VGFARLGRVDVQLMKRAWKRWADGKVQRDRAVRHCQELPQLEKETWPIRGGKLTGWGSTRILQGFAHLG
jgi:hypothetical protein